MCSAECLLTRKEAIVTVDPVLVLIPSVVGPTHSPTPAATELNSANPSEPAFQRVDSHAPWLPVTDLGVTRGEGAFETIGVFDGNPVNVGPHLERLQRSAQMLDMPELNLEVIRQALTYAISQHPAAPELAVKIIVTAGIEGERVPLAWVHARVNDDCTAAREGLRMAVLDRGVPSTVAQTSPWLLAGAKSLSYAVNMAAIREANRRGADDALFVSSDGFCLEGPTSTLLVRRGQEFVTTPPSAGVLPGTTLLTAFEYLTTQGYECREELLTVEEVAASDGAWMLSSVRLAAPITHLDEREMPVDAQFSVALCAALAGRLRG